MSLFKGAAFSAKKIAGLTLLSALASALPLPVMPEASAASSILPAKTYYVSPIEYKGIISRNGLNWVTAWKDVDQIDWSKINPGDTIEIDGGSDKGPGITYNGALIVGKSGIPNLPITITTSKDIGHNGYVRLNNLAGITVGKSNINIQGRKWGRLSVGAAYTPSRIQILLPAANVKLSNIVLAGSIYLGNDISNITFSQLIVDGSAGINSTLASNCVYSMPAVNGVHFKRCWLLNSSNVNKFNAVEFSKSRNIQASSTAMNFRDCIIGPGLDSFMDMPNVGNSKVSVNGGLFINPTRNSTPIPDKFAMANTTTFTAYPNASCLNTQGVPNISNSIFYGGIVSVSNANSLLGPANFQFKTTGNTTVLSRGQVDPKFTSDVSKITPLVSKHGEISISEKRAYVVRLALLDFALQGKSPAKGSGAHVTSIKQLLSVNSP